MATTTTTTSELQDVTNSLGSVNVSVEKSASATLTSPRERRPSVASTTPCSVTSLASLASSNFSFASESEESPDVIKLAARAAVERGEAKTLALAEEMLMLELACAKSAADMARRTTATSRASEEEQAEGEETPRRAEETLTTEDPNGSRDASDVEGTPTLAEAA